MKKYFLGLVVLLPLLFVGCDEDTEDPDANCVKQWIGVLYEPQPQIFVDHEAAKLFIQVNGATKDTILEIYQDIADPSASFELYMEFESFVTPSPLGYIEMVVFDPIIADTISDTTIVACVLRSGKMQAVTGTFDTTTVNVNPTKGRMIITKSPGFVKSEIIVGTDTVRSSKLYTFEPKRVAIRFRNKDTYLANTLGIKFSQFFISDPSGTTGLKADGFKCNSVLIQ